jgi:predicted DNA-binding transcriptional regulator AlpA
MARTNARPPDPAARYWRRPQVETYTGRSRSRIYGDTMLPRPVKIGPNTAAWLSAEVIAWCEAHEAESRQQAAA